ncbi:MAG TPA: bifunctional acyl-ACP--phospholipid O-acyltransferase/long-chain-fatty-acid--ACP ligase [Bryobacteraceae bacterium]|nr:bifunctional acyl-ACP--phospholipid O-acyltransferase/long-chain-fatty-acid--ACP ligase [Bryobacteraceae bacterium]
MIPIARVVIRFLLRLLFRAELRGYVKPVGKTLIVANHQSFMDGLLIGAFLPFAPTYLVHTTIAAKWHFKILLSAIDHLVIDSTNPLSMKTVIALLESGAPVVIFPEGRITVTGSRMKIYDGPAFAAAKSGAQVVPIHIDGLVYSHFSRMPADFPKRWFPKVTLTMHTPQPLPMPEAPRARDRRRMASNELRRIMQLGEFDARRETTIPDELLTQVKRFGKHRPLIEDIRGKEETLGDLLRMTLALGRLTSKWTSEGERVGVLMPTATPTAAMIIGLMAMRRIPAMLNYTSGREGLENACRIAEVKTVFASRAFIEKAKLTSMMENFTAARVMYLEDVRPQFGLLDKLWLVLFALRFPKAAMKKPRPEEMAIVLFTSGSEGKPKGVALSHANILANCAQARAVIEVSHHDKFLNSLPLFHSFGLLGGLVLPLTSGSRIFMYPSPLHYRVIPEIAYDRDCTVLFATSTFLGNYAKYAHPYDLYMARYVVSGAEKLSEEVRRLYAEKFGIRILEGYGATECSPIISLNLPMSYQLGTVGEPLPGIEYKLAPVQGIENGGELHVRGPNVMMGYFLDRAPGVLQPPRSQFGDGWYDTGDIVEIDARRHITIQGRLKRFAKVAGEMVSLEVVERIAVAASPKRMHASAAAKEESRGESIVLFTDDPALKREGLVAAARENGLPELALPRRVIHLDKVPLLGNGKKDYVKLQAMANEAAKR